MMVTYLLPSLIGALAGAVAATLLTWLLLHRQDDRRNQDTSPADDPWLDAEIDRAAASWAMQNGCPEAAPIMADKLHLLHRLGQRRGWSR